MGRTRDKAHGGWLTLLTGGYRRRPAGSAWCRPLLAVLVCAWFPGLAQAVDLPDMGASVDSVLSPQQEKAIGKMFMRQIRAQMEIIEDPEVDEYIQTLGDHLASSTPEAHAGFTFFVVGSGAINAFAAPGGYIGVNSGLITATESESELAAVMAHEIAHVTQRHIARRFEAMERTSGAMLAAMAAAILVGSQNPEAGMAAMTAAQAAQTQMALDYTRANELEADRVGIITLANADFDPRSMPVFFERLERASRYYGRPPEFLSTHPVTANRIADTRGRAEQFPHKQHLDSQAYHLVQAKLRVLSADNPKDAVEYFKGALKTGQHRNRVAARYGYALALAHAGQRRQARTRLQRLHELDPDNVSFRAELANLELSVGNTDEAMTLYEDGLTLYPNNRMLLEGYITGLIQVGRPAEAIQQIRDYERYNELNIRFLELLARSSQEAGDPAGAHIALGEAYYMLGNLKAAIGQYERALKAGTKDRYQASRVQAKLQRLKKEQAQRKKKR